jgi:23S rRNA (cytosine1962-C5)-methyltransferase
MNPETSPLPVVHLKIERRSAHPWVFQKMVEKPNLRLPPGAVVDVLDRGGQWVGRGLFNGHSRISLRILTAKQDEAIDAAFFAKMIGAAIAFRRDTLRLDEVSNAYRLVYSEADGLSGLVVDRFGDTIVIEFFAAGMFRQRQVIMDVLKTHFPEAKFYWFAEEHVGKQESFDCRPPEPPPPNVILENGLKFRVAAGSKHKTGFFLDQRDNRKYLGELSRGKRVLDICCNSGGFGVYAKAMGASEVTGLDLDEVAIDLAKQNAKLNNAQIRYVQADLFSWLRDIIPNKEQFDVVVLDPAKLTRDRESVDLALKKYCDMNRLAMHVVKPGGVLLTCSCTGLVSEPDFIESIRRAAWQAQRNVQVFKITGAGPDHPFLMSVPEGRYLKAVFCKVD